MAAIEACRTPVLGGHVEQCGDCQLVFAYNSCRNRHCPKCQGLARARVARGAAGRVAAGALFSCHLHLAGTGGGDCVPEQARGLRRPVPRCGRCNARHRRRPQASRGRDRRGRGAAHLGASTTAPSAFALHRARRRPVIRWHAVGGGLARLLSAGACPLPAVPCAVPRAVTDSVHGRRVALLRHARGHGRIHRLRRASRYTARQPIGWSMPSARSQDPGRCWPISAATPIASHWPTRV